MDDTSTEPHHRFEGTCSERGVGACWGRWSRRKATVVTIRLQSDSRRDHVEVLLLRIKEVVIITSAIILEACCEKQYNINNV
jgi:hypothetical protein